MTEIETSINDDMKVIGRVHQIKCELIAEKIMGYQPISKDEIGKFSFEKFFTREVHGEKVAEQKRFWKKTGDSYLENYYRKVPDYSMDYERNLELLEKLRVDYSVVIYNIRSYWIVSIYSKEKKEYLSSGWHIKLQDAVVNSVFSLISKIPQTNTFRKNTIVGVIFKTSTLRLLQHFYKPKDVFGVYEKEGKIRNKEDIVFDNLNTIEKTVQIKCELIAEKVMGYQPVTKEEFYKFFSKEVMRQLNPFRAKIVEEQNKFWRKSRSIYKKEYSTQVPDYSMDYEKNLELLETLSKDYSMCIYNKGFYWVVSIYSKDKMEYLSSGRDVLLQAAVVNSVYKLLLVNSQVKTFKNKVKITNYIKALTIKLFRFFDKPEDNFGGYKEFDSEVFSAARKELNLSPIKHYRSSLSTIGDLLRNKGSKN